MNINSVQAFGIRVSGLDRYIVLRWISALRTLVFIGPRWGMRGKILDHLDRGPPPLFRYSLTTAPHILNSKSTEMRVVEVVLLHLNCYLVSVYIRFGYTNLFLRTVNIPTFRQEGATCSYNSTNSNLQSSSKGFVNNY